MRLLKAVGSFFAGFALQLVSLDGHLSADPDSNRWFARGEKAVYWLLALVALAVVLGLAVQVL